MKLVVGLGNPGPEYRDTRHNVGFQVIDFLSANHRIRLNRQKHQALWGEGRINGCPVVLAQPITFMNRSGRAVKALLKAFTEGAQDLLVVHDDIDLAVGRIKIKQQGGDAGHRGIRSILDEVGTDRFLRVRVGVGRPPRGADVADYVLSPFDPEELPEASRARESAAALVEDLLEKAMKGSWWEEAGP